MICNNLDVNAAGHLTFAGRDTVELAKTYGTPAYFVELWGKFPSPVCQQGALF